LAYALFDRSSNAGSQGVWGFEIGSSSDTFVPAKVSSVLASLEPSEEDQELTSKPFMSDYGSTEIRPQYVTSSTDSIEEDQHVTYSVPQLAVEDFITSYQDVTGTPSTESFYRHREFPTAKAPPRQFPAQQFPPQGPQVIDVEEFDETGIGKVFYKAWIVLIQTGSKKVQIFRCDILGTFNNFVLFICDS